MLGSRSAPAGASEDSRPSAASRSTSTSASASASGASSSLPAPVGRANESSVPSAATSSSPTSASAQANGASGTLLAAGTTRVSAPPTYTNPVSASSVPTLSVGSSESSVTTFTGQPSMSAQSASRSEGSSSAAPVPAFPPMHAIIPMPFPRYIRLEELSSVVNEASETTVREGTRAVADNLGVSFESLARLMVHLAREPPLRFNLDLDERLERAEGLQAVVNAVVPPADAPPGRDEELAALVDACEDLRFRLADADAALAREVADRQRVEARSHPLSSRQQHSDGCKPPRPAARQGPSVYLQHRVDRSDYRAAVAKYSAEVAQLNRLLQSSATPVSPSAQPAGAFHGSQWSPSSRPTNPGKRPLSKSSAAGLSLAAAGLGSSGSDSEDSGPLQGFEPVSSRSGGLCGLSSCSLLPSKPFAGVSESCFSVACAAGIGAAVLGSVAPSGAAPPSPPGPRAASPAAPEMVDLSGDDQVDEAPASVDTSHEISLSTLKRRDGRPTREASVTGSLRSKASLEELLASDDLVLGPQSPSDDTDGPPSPPSGAAGTPPRCGFVGVCAGPGLCGSVIATTAASCIHPSTDRCLGRCSYRKSRIGLCFFGTPAAWSIAAIPDQGHTLDHAGHQPERVYTCDVASATSSVGSSESCGEPRVSFRLQQSNQVPDTGIRGKWGPRWLGARSTTPGAGSVADEREDPMLGGWDPGLRQLRGSQPPVAATEDAGSPVSDLGFASWERGHWIPIGAIEHWLDAFAQEVGEDSAEFQAVLAAWIEFDRARNLRADRYRQQVPHRYWDWAIRPSSDPAHIPPELMLEPTILTFSFEVIPWIPKTADWVSEVSVVDDRQPWRNCWIDVSGQHPFNTTFAHCNPPVPLFVPRGFTRQQVIDDIMLNPQLSAQEIISPWAVELLNRRTHPGTPPPASPAAPVDDESKGDSPQSSAAAAAALVGAASSTGDVSEASVTDTPAGSSRP
ncbi:unnamed protein product [Phytophthora lilii]|uniref:Unnamed protein product n=1 Tax=Phytophthora lilii TaxID=2077276 RepID=A0A9W7CGH5_9STRA|nr:unnamed protein product [Phytophthora lilii]